MENLCAGGVGCGSCPAETSRQTPARGRGNTDLVVGDVTLSTAVKYEKAMTRFETYLKARGAPSIVSLLEQRTFHETVSIAARYLGVMYAEDQLSASLAGTFVSAFKRFLLLVGALGFPIPDLEASLRPLWRLHRAGSWQPLRSFDVRPVRNMLFRLLRWAGVDAS